MTATTADVPVQPPGASFNFAAHLLACNAGRPDRTAYIDDDGRLNYGELAQQVRRMAAALLGAGVRREERVLLLMHDCKTVHWASPNRSPTRSRRALGFVYFGVSAKADEEMKRAAERGLPA